MQVHQAHNNVTSTYEKYKSDHLSPLVIMLFGEQIAMPLSILINMSMSEGIVPD